ncbi:MAG: VOC family protein [Chloroflexi bacterium]|nr:VOC family protein [Chloroflexota bacterium]
MNSGEFPTPSMELTTILVSGDVERSRDFYRDVLGARVHDDGGAGACVLQFQGAWILLVTGGEPTEDKPGVTFAPPSDPDRVSASFTIRVPDCRDAYDVLRSRGAAFLTPPLDRGREVRCFFRDPDGHLLEISELTG